MHRNPEYLLNKFQQFFNCVYTVYMHLWGRYEQILQRHIRVQLINMHFANMVYTVYLLQTYPIASFQATWSKSSFAIMCKWCGTYILYGYFWLRGSYYCPWGRKYLPNQFQIYLPVEIFAIFVFYWFIFWSFVS